MPCSVAAAKSWSSRRSSSCGSSCRWCWGCTSLVPPRWRNALLALASLVFYAWGAHAIVLVFLASITINYTAGRLIGRYRGQDRAARGASRGGRRGDRRSRVLFVWKYAVFAANQCRRSLLGASASTMRSAGRRSRCRSASRSSRSTAISYVVDMHRGRRRGRCGSVADFTQYMAFFPQLIAGPIVRYHQIDDQIRDPPPRSSGSTTSPTGFPRFALGLVQEGADRRPGGADRRRRFASARSPTTPTAWLGALAYTVQIYFDFSGYTRHGDRPGPDVRLPLPGELRPAVFVDVDDRLLAALAHDAVALVPRLRLHPARRQRAAPERGPRATCCSCSC